MVQRTIERMKSGNLLKIRIPPKAVQAAFARSQQTPWERLSYTAAKLFLPPLVRRGDWDLRAGPVAEFPTLRFMKAGVESNWEPAAVQRALAEYYRVRRRESGGKTAEVMAEERLERVLAKYRGLTENMARNGYVPGAAPDEVGIGIGRDGRLIKVANGNHRFALAVLLDLPTIVAEVSVVHVDWYRQGRGAGRGLERLRRRLQEEGFELWEPARHS